MTLTAQQIEIIKTTVPVLQAHGLAITTLLYNNMLGENPELFNIFNKTKQVDGRQPHALAGALSAYASNIDNLPVLNNAISGINRKHVSLFVQPEQYDIVGKYLFEAMGQVLGDALTSDILDAWATAYKQLADLMIGQEKVLYSGNPDWADWRDLAIEKKVQESAEITSFYLKALNCEPLPSYRPGQYISIRTHIPHFPHLQARQYSLSDSPHSNYYRISVKREDGLDITEKGSQKYPGSVSNVLHGTDEGAKIQVSPPHGDFVLDDTNDAVVLISAGVGITPLMAMLNHLIAQKKLLTISWIHAARQSSSQAFGEHVRSMVEFNPNVHENVFLKNLSKNDKLGATYHHVGRIDLDKLDPEKDFFFNKKQAGYYVCGPESFMQDVKTGLVAKGVNNERVKLESFGAGAN